MKPARALAPLMICIASWAFGQEAPQVIRFEGRPIRFSDRDRPYTEGGATMVSLYPIARAIDAKITVKGNANFTVTRGRDHVDFRLGEWTYWFNGAKMEPTGAAQSQKRTVFVSFDVLQTLAGSSLRLERSSSSIAAGNSGIYFKNRQISYQSGETPISTRGTWLVALKRTASYMGAQVDEKRDGSVTVSFFGDKVETVLGKQAYRFNGKLHSLSASSQRARGVVFVPIEMLQALSGNDLSVRR